MESEKNNKHSGERLTDEDILTDKDEENAAPAFLCLPKDDFEDEGNETSGLRGARGKRRLVRQRFTKEPSTTKSEENGSDEDAEGIDREDNETVKLGVERKDTESEDEGEDGDEENEKATADDDDTVNIPVLFYEITEALATAVCMVVLVFTLVVRAAVVSGYSMEHTLSGGDVLVVSTIPFEPRYGDIIVFQKFDSYPDHEVVVKRVIATEGQTVDIDFDTWTVTVDGKVIDESGYLYIAEDGYNRDKKMQFPVTVGEGELFVMGDNRKHSTDSREVGLIDERTVFGRVIMRISPITQFKIFGRF